MNSCSKPHCKDPADSASFDLNPKTPEERGWEFHISSILMQVIGPDFHGPSSSHTGGAQRIALAARRLLGNAPKSAHITFFNSFATTGEGHHSPRAVKAGLLGFETTDPRTPSADRLFEESGTQIFFKKILDDRKHPNTLLIELERGGDRVLLKGVSIGGGNIQIAEQALNLASVA